MKMSGETISESSSDGDSFSPWDVLTARYDKSQRARIDRFKEEEDLGADEDMEEEISPTRAQKIGRALLDILRLRLRKVEAQRDREARIIARRELREEIRRAEAEESERSDLDEQLLLRAMDEYRDYAVRSRDSFLIRQESIERSLNDNLTQISQLEEEALDPNSGVTKRTVRYVPKDKNGEDMAPVEIPVYDLTGYRFRQLSTCTGIASDGNPEYKKLARKRLEHPELWTRTLDEIKDEPGFLKKGAYNDTISASYRDTGNKTRDAILKPSAENVVYGFCKVAPKSVVTSRSSDSGTPGEALSERTRPDIASHWRWEEHTAWDKIHVTKVEDFSPDKGQHDEVAFARYDEKGNPVLPDYIYTQNNAISRYDLLHAYYFGVPIINLNTASYETEEEKALYERDRIARDEEEARRIAMEEEKRKAREEAERAQKEADAERARIKRAKKELIKQQREKRRNEIIATGKCESFEEILQLSDDDDEAIVMLKAVAEKGDKQKIADEVIAELDKDGDLERLANGDDMSDYDWGGYYESIRDIFDFDYSKIYSELHGKRE